MTRIFISYRRSDEPEIVARLRDRLRAVYGDDDVFRDTDSIPGGARFDDVITTELGACSAALVVIGPRWLIVADSNGRRLDEPDDPVCREVARTLERAEADRFHPQAGAFKLIPLLVGGAEMPTQDELPASIRRLHDYNARKLRSDTFDYDFDQLRSDLGLPPAAHETDVAGQRSRRRSVVAAVAFGILLMVAVGAALTIPDSSRHPAPKPQAMTGDFNIAIADFTATNPANQARSTAMATQMDLDLRKALASEIASGSIQIRGPNTIGPITGSTMAQRKVVATRVANDNGADVVIDGRVNLPSSVVPEAYLASIGLGNNPELSNLYSFGNVATNISYSTLTDRRLLSSNITGASVALAHFMLGVSYYSVLGHKADPSTSDKATAQFNAVLESPIPLPFASLSRVFLGSLNLYEVSGMGEAPDQPLAAAKTQFDQAVKLDPSSTQGRLGLADIELFQSSEDRCAAGTVDAPGLASVAKTFAAIGAVAGPDQAVTLRAKLGLATALRCQGQAGLDPNFARVEKLLKEVIADTRGHPEFTELAAVAHAELALAVAPSVGTLDPTALKLSLSATHEAVHETKRSCDKALYYWQLAFYQVQLGRDADAFASLAAATKIQGAFASVKPSDLVAQKSGRLVPMRQSGLVTVAQVAQLPFTGPQPVSICP